jgi:hypothetical protein
MRRPGAGGAALKEMLAAVHATTPRDATETGPMGYRFKNADRAPRGASLVLQTEDQLAEGFYCAGIYDDGVVYTTHTFVTVYVNGTITASVTQPDPGPHLVNADHPTRFSCPSTDYETDAVPGKDYGSEVSGEDSFSGAVDVEGALSLALDNMEPTGTVVDVGMWGWGEYDAAPDTSDYTLNLAHYLSPGLGDYISHMPRYRWSNTGQLHLGVHWQEGDTTRSIIVAPGEVTDWYDSTPTGVINVYSQLTNLELTYPAT